jgi:hypothetical protein
VFFAPARKAPNTFRERLSRHVGISANEQLTMDALNMRFPRGIRTSPQNGATWCIAPYKKTAFSRVKRAQKALEGQKNQLRVAAPPAPAGLM